MVSSPLTSAANPKSISDNLNCFITLLQYWLSPKSLNVDKIVAPMFYYYSQKSKYS